MAVIMFQHRFADLVATGKKNQTIRPIGKRKIEKGMKLSLRKWEGKAYRSKQIVLKEVTCISVAQVYLDHHGFHSSDGHTLSSVANDMIARADGFESFQALLEWFKETHGLPFNGRLIQWL